MTKGKSQQNRKRGRQKGDSDKASQYLRRGLSISQEIGDANLMASAHHSAGFVHQFTNWKTAVEHYKEGIKLCEKIGNIQLMASCHHWLGIVYYWRAKDSELAIKCFKEGIELDRERQFPFSTGFMFSRLSEIYRDKGEWDEVIKHAQEALRIGTTIGRDDLFIDTGENDNTHPNRHFPRRRRLEVGALRRFGENASQRV